MLHVVRFNREAPAYRCRVCKEAFYDGEDRAYERHVIACAERHDDKLRANSLMQQAPGIFDPNQSGDVEYGRWVKENREAILEGRKRM